MKFVHASFASSVFVLLLCGALFSCRKNKTTSFPVLGIPADTACSYTAVDSFPFQTGRQWSYIVHRQNQGEPDSTFSFTITVTGDTVINGIRLAQLKSAGASSIPFLSSIDTVPGTFYIAKLSKGWYEFSSLSGLSGITYADSALGEFLLHSPAANGVTWYQLPYATTGLRNFSGYNTVNTSAGIFNTRGVIGAWNPGTWFQSQFFYLCNQGMVRSYRVNYTHPPVSLSQSTRTVVVELVSKNF